jgi:hypothetical protein
MTDTAPTLSFGKALADTSVGTLSDSISKIDVDKALTENQVINEIIALRTDKYLEDTTVGDFTNEGKVWMNSYQGQDYYSEEYSVGLEETFTN